MKMEFIFDEEKLKNEGYTQEACLEPIRKYFAKYNSPTIKEIEPGVFIGSDDDWSIFGATAHLPHTDWFLKVIKEWYWYVDEGDGKGEQKEDFLASFYKYRQQ